LSDNKDHHEWDLVIRPRTGWFEINLIELMRFRDLIYLFVKRDFVTFYKQTILGPLWFIIQPLVNTVIFTVIFGKIADIPTDGVPPFIFYLSGTVIWGYFAQCLLSTSNTFVQNSAIFGKVYFPRLSVPISNVISGLFQFGIQFAVFLAFYFYFWYAGAEIKPTYWILGLPLILLQMAVLGFGTGVLLSSLTAKYRDLSFAMTFAVQIWMYLTPVVYPLSQVPEEYRIFYALNPMVALVESFRMAFLGAASVEIFHITLSVSITAIVFVVGVIMFSRVEKTFMDTV
jgi:lipopolysaccharide transport system permease protein